MQIVKQPHKLKSRRMYFKANEKQQFTVYKSIFERRGYHISEINVNKGFCFEARPPRRI